VTRWRHRRRTRADKIRYIIRRVPTTGERVAEARAELERALARWRELTGELSEVQTDSGIPVEPLYTPLDAPEGRYLERVGLPGEYPFTRGIYPSMYRGRLFTMRLYAGWGGPEDTNERFRYLLEQGQTGLSVALDLPTQMGLDSDHPLAAGEVGKVGVAIDSLADMERVFGGIPLDRVSTSFTINATAPVLLAMYQVAGEKQGVDPAELRGTVQNDILKEFLARKTYIYPPGPSLRLVADVIEYAARHLPKFNPISVCGYHMRQAGCDAVQEIAYTLANAAAYVQAVIDRGLDVDEFAGQFSFNISTMRDFFEEIAKHRAARRLWAGIMRERFGAKDPRSWTLRLFSGGDGTSLTGVEPLNNVVRTALQTLAIVLSGAQAVHTISWDEALALPTEEAALLALRTQQIVAHESGVTRTADPLGGAYFLESLTDELEQRATKLLEEVERDGVLRGIENGSLELAIAEAAYRQQAQIESGERVVVGVNRFRDERAGEQDVEILVISEEARDRQLRRLAEVRASRDGARAAATLAAVKTAAASHGSTMPAILDAVRAYATVGEISDALGAVFGFHRASTVV
jgi:methylmalonyl-CoA mutase N-terminal domain/subunit